MAPERSRTADRLHLDAPSVEADPAFTDLLASRAAAAGPVRRQTRSRLAIAAAGLAVAATTLTAAYAATDLRSPAAPDAPPATHDRGPSPTRPPGTAIPDPERVEHGTPDRRHRPHRVALPPVAAQPEAPTASRRTAVAPSPAPTAQTPIRHLQPAPIPRPAAPTVRPDEPTGAPPDDHGDDGTSGGTGDGTGDGTADRTPDDAGATSGGTTDVAPDGVTNGVTNGASDGTTDTPDP